MKIFGKRKSSGTKPTTTDDTSSSQPGETAAPTENVASYFSIATDDDGPKTKKAKSAKSSETINGEEMDKLLSMDYESLNSKQRRLVRRYKERDGSAEDTRDDVEAEEKQAHAPPKESNNKPTVINEKEQQLLEKLSTMNSKDRRKFLRQLRTDDNTDVDVDKLEEEAKRIAERNVAEAQDTPKKKEDARKQDTPTKDETKEKNKPKSTKKQKDVSHLPPEEQARRAQQRAAQIAAASLRSRLADGTATAEEVAANALHRHPLNSERRRANRRKPARKSFGKGGGGGGKGNGGGSKGQFNEVGYRMRRG